MSFTAELWQANHHLYQQTLNLPFNQQLAVGTLAKEKFCHYMIQDAHYLLAYGRALSVVAAKADIADDVVFFAEAAREAVVVERSLHEGFMRDFDISQEQFLHTELTPVCHHYCYFLQAMAFSHSYPVAVAAMLPCFWIYAEVGKDICSKSALNNPYQAWIDTYAGEEFNQAVSRARDITDRIAAKSSEAVRKQMHAAYRDAARLEWMFWDSAFNLKSWDV